MAVASGNEVSVCDHPMTGRDFRESVIGGAITYALEIGQILRRAKEESRDAASAIAEAKDGAVLFRGVVSAMPWESRDGFNFGSISLAGTGEYEGQFYRIDFQNENIAAYRDGPPGSDGAGPDLHDRRQRRPDDHAGLQRRR